MSVFVQYSTYSSTVSICKMDILPQVLNTWLHFPNVFTIYVTLGRMQSHDMSWNVSVNVWRSLPHTGIFYPIFVWHAYAGNLWPISFVCEHTQQNMEMVMVPDVQSSNYLAVKSLICPGALPCIPHTRFKALSGCLLKAFSVPPVPPLFLMQHLSGCYWSLCYPLPLLLTALGLTARSD